MNIRGENQTVTTEERDPKEEEYFLILLRTYPIHHIDVVVIVEYVRRSAPSIPTESVIVATAYDTIAGVLWVHMTDCMCTKKSDCGGNS